MNQQLSNELIALAEYDLAVRERLLNEGKLSDGYNPEMEQVHRQNAARLKEIIAEIGWPARSKVGEEASEAAWLIVQHAIGEPDFMKHCYSLMLEAEADVNPQNIAYMYDRICFFEGRPQKYGTQFGEGLYPVENKNEVNKWRQELRLKPHPEDIIVEVKPSADLEDLHKDNAAFTEWRRKVGWIP